MSENVTGCVVHSQPQAAVVGLLCMGHFEKLAQMLRDVETEACMLDARPSLAQRSGSGGGSLASERAPARLDVIVHMDKRSRQAGQRPPGPACVECWHGSCIDIRAWIDAYDAQAADTLSILDVLSSWARVVREERDLEGPSSITISGERDTLTRHLDWLASQPFIDEMLTDVRQLLGQLRSANGTSALRKKPVGICPTLFEDGECGGRLWPDDVRGAVVCDLCDRVFLPEELRHLGDMLIRQGYVEVFRAAWYTGVPPGTIRRWVAERRMTSEKDGRKLMVQISEVEQLNTRKRRRSTGAAS